MGACGYRAFENTCKKFTQRQLRALGCTPDEEDGRYYPPSDSTFQRVLNKVDAVGRGPHHRPSGSRSRRLAPWPNWPSMARCCAAAAVTMANRCSCSRP